MDTKAYTLKLTKTELDTMETALLIAQESRGDFTMGAYHRLDGLIEKVEDAHLPTNLRRN